MAAALYFLPPPSTEAHFTIDQSWEARLLQTYPELLHLADDQAVNTQEGFASHEPSPSTRFFGKKYIEFDRTLLTIRCLEMILAGKYQEFVAGQESHDQLTLKSFLELKALGEKLLADLQISKDVMIAALVLGDMGKCPEIRQKFPEIKEPDHDDFEREWLKVLWSNPALCKTYERLQPRERELIGNASGLAHFGHIFHQEGGPEMFAHLASQQNLDVNVLNFALFIQRCDVAGARGHVNPTSSLAFTQKVYDGYMAVADACLAVLKEGATAESIYQAALRTRGALCGFQEDEAALPIRLAAMMRLTTPEEGALLKEALGQISQEYKQPLPCPPLTATYMPAVLVNKMEATQGSPADKIKAAVQWGLPLLQAGLALECPDGVRHCFNELARQAKEGAEGTVVVDSNGNISLKIG